MKIPVTIDMTWRRLSVNVGCNYRKVYAQCSHGDEKHYYYKIIDGEKKIYNVHGFLAKRPLSYMVEEDKIEEYDIDYDEMSTRYKHYKKCIKYQKLLAQLEALERDIMAAKPEYDEKYKAIFESYRKMKSGSDTMDVHLSELDAIRKHYQRKEFKLILEHFGISNRKEYLFWVRDNHPDKGGCDELVACVTEAAIATGKK